VSQPSKGAVAIEVQELHKSYGSFVALRGISFSVLEGQVVGFLGPNGAGKSTAMKILTGFLSPSAGSARIQGHDVLEDPLLARASVGYLPENAPIYPDMRVRDYLDYVSQVRGLGRAERASALDRVSEQCGIRDRMDQRVGDLSKGYRQRVGLAQAMVHSPPILILDEPTTGLDPNQIVEIRNLIREIGRHKTVLLSTHILSEVQATCDRVIIIHNGRLAADGSTDEVTMRTRGGQLLSVVLAPGKVQPRAESVEAALRALPGVEGLRPMEAEQAGWFAYELLVSGELRADIFQLAVDQGLRLIELSRERTNLEEVFRRLTLASTEEAPADQSTRTQS
jgi:ABC-2 type transport system ATP-binding protein